MYMVLFTLNQLCLRLYTNTLLPVFHFPHSLFSPYGPSSFSSVPVSTVISSVICGTRAMLVFLFTYMYSIWQHHAAWALTSLTLTRSEGIRHCRWSLTGMRERVRERLARRQGRGLTVRKNLGSILSLHFKVALHEMGSIRKNQAIVL